jgi:hypothetical protein
MTNEERLERLELLVLDLAKRVEALEPEEGLSSLEQQHRLFLARRERKEG